MARPLPQRLAHGQLQHLFLLPADPIEIPEILRVIPINQLKLEGFPRENREKNSGITGAKQRKNSEKRDVCTLLMLQPKASLEPSPYYGNE